MKEDAQEPEELGWAIMPFWHKLTLEHPSLSNPQHHTHKILMLQENDGVVWPFMEGEDTL
jgi:hypothetical protein